MNLNKCVLSFLNTSSGLMYRKLGDISELEMCDSGYKVGNEPPMDGWRPYDVNIPFTAYDAHFWIRANFRTKFTGSHAKHPPMNDRKRTFRA